MVVASLFRLNIVREEIAARPKSKSKERGGQSVRDYPELLHFMKVGNRIEVNGNKANARTGLIGLIEKSRCTVLVCSVSSRVIAETKRFFPFNSAIPLLMNHQRRERERNSLDETTMSGIKNV